MVKIGPLLLNQTEIQHAGIGLDLQECKCFAGVEMIKVLLDKS